MSSNKKHKRPGLSQDARVNPAPDTRGRSNTAQNIDWKLMLQQLLDRSGHTAMFEEIPGTAEYVWKDATDEVPMSQAFAFMNYVQAKVIKKENQVKNPDLNGIRLIKKDGNSAVDEGYISSLARALDRVRPCVTAIRAATAATKRGEHDKERGAVVRAQLSLISVLCCELAKQSTALYTSLARWLDRVAPMTDMDALPRLSSEDLAQVSRFLCIRLSMLRMSAQGIGIIMDNVPEPCRNDEMVAVLPGGKALGVREGWMVDLGQPLLDEFGVIMTVQHAASTAPNISPFLDWVFLGQATVPCLELRAACREEVLGQSLSLEDAYEMLVEAMKEQREWEELAEELDSAPWEEDLHSPGATEKALEAKVRAAYGIPADAPPHFASNAPSTVHILKEVEALLHDVRKDESVARLRSACNRVNIRIRESEQRLEMHAVGARLEMIKTELHSSIEIISRMDVWQTGLLALMEKLTSYRVAGFGTSVEQVMEAGELDKARERADEQRTMMFAQEPGSADPISLFPGLRRILQGMREDALGLDAQRHYDWDMYELRAYQANYRQQVHVRLVTGSGTLHMLWQQLAHVACRDPATTIGEQLLRPIFAERLVSGAAAWREQRERLMQELVEEEEQEKARVAAKAKQGKGSAKQPGGGGGGKAKAGGSKAKAADLMAASGAGSTRFAASAAAATTDAAGTVPEATASTLNPKLNTRAVPGLDRTAAAASTSTASRTQEDSAREAAQRPQAAAYVAPSSRRKSKGSKGAGAAAQLSGVDRRQVAASSPADPTVPPSSGTPLRQAAVPAATASVATAAADRSSLSDSAVYILGGTAADASPTTPASITSEGVRTAALGIGGGATMAISGTAATSSDASAASSQVSSQATLPAATTTSVATAAADRPGSAAADRPGSATADRPGSAAAAASATAAASITSEGVRTTASGSGDGPTMAMSGTAAPGCDMSAVSSRAAPSTPSAATAGSAGFPPAVHSSMRAAAASDPPPRSSQATQPPTPRHRQMAPPPSGPLSLLLALRDGTNTAGNLAVPVIPGRQAPGGGGASSAPTAQPQRHSVAQPMARPGSNMGHALGHGEEPSEDDEDEESEDLYCPITLKLMQDPVMAADTHTYERSAIEEWLRSHNTSPLTGAPLPSNVLLPNTTLRKVIQGYLTKQARRNRPVQA